MAHWIRFEHQGQTGFGVLEHGSIKLHSGDMFGGAQPTGAVVSLAEVRVLTPTQPSKMVALWNNFHALAAKLGNPEPPEPLYFLKGNNSFLAHGETIRVPASYSGKVVYEGELGVVIGRKCSMISEADAGVVRVLTSDGQHLRMVAARGLPPEVVEKEHLVSRDCGQCGVAICLNRPLFEIDLKGCDERTGGNFFKTGCQAMVVVPLQNAGRLLGTYNLFLPEAFELPEEVALLFRSIGEHLGMALENADLYADSRRKVQEFEALYQLGRTMASTFNLQDILSRINQMAPGQSRRLQARQAVSCMRETKTASKK